MKDFDGTNNFSVEVGEGREGINHTLDFGEGTMVSLIQVDCKLIVIQPSKVRRNSLNQTNIQSDFVASTGKIRSGSFEASARRKDDVYFRRRRRSSI